MDQIASPRARAASTKSRVPMSIATARAMRATRGDWMSATVHTSTGIELPSPTMITSASSIGGKEITTSTMRKMKVSTRPPASAA